MSVAEKTKLLNSKIAEFLVLKGYSKAELALKLGISLSAFYAKLKSIDSYSYREISALCRILQLDDDTRLLLLK